MREHAIYVGYLRMREFISLRQGALSVGAGYIKSLDIAASRQCVASDRYETMFLKIVIVIVSSSYIYIYIYYISIFYRRSVPQP